jgi:hypothetical protein
MQLTIWLVPAGTVDRLGYSQPAYLDIGNKLLQEPADDTAMQARDPEPTPKRGCLVQGTVQGPMPCAADSEICKPP